MGRDDAIRNPQADGRANVIGAWLGISSQRMRVQDQHGIVGHLQMGAESKVHPVLDFAISLDKRHKLPHRDTGKGEGLRCAEA